MSNPVPNLRVVIKTMADVVVGTALYTNELGNISVPLAPGEYKAVVDPLPGYTFKDGAMVEAGVSTPITSLTILGITISSSESVNATINLLQS